MTHEITPLDWGTKLFESQTDSALMPFTELLEILSSADDVPKDIRAVASDWKKSGKKPATKDSAAAKDWIERVYGSYESMSRQHEGHLRKLAELRDRSMSSFTTYIRSIQSSTLPNRFGTISEQANKVFGQLDPKTFVDDTLLLPQGAKHSKTAQMIIEVWNDPAAAAEQTTGAARALRRHEFLMLYRDDNGAAGIETNAAEEAILLKMFAEKWTAESAGPLLPFLKPLIEIACSLRGYKSAVSHVTVLQAGAATFPNSRNVSDEKQ